MIRVLEKQVSDKIAAGEVIENPASIVKELLENAIDAGATNISVEIRKGGKTYIRITDNGCGIVADQVETAFLRHATSKIQQVEDLDHLQTLGFRGEALASIAAVSRMTMITKPKEARVGVRISLDGGSVSDKVATGCPDGTTIIVRDLFYNTPAREKFLRSDAGETNSVIELTRSLAMANADIAFRMTSNDKVLFATHGSGNLLDAISQVIGAETGSHLVPVSGQQPGMALHGYVSGSGESRASRKEQIFFVNGRVVNSKPIERGIAKAYADKLFAGRFPMAYLFLEVQPETIDVNIHPNKKEIRFDDDAVVTDLVSGAIVKALQVKEAIPKIEKISTPVESLLQPVGSKDDNKLLRESNKPFTSSTIEKPVAEKQLDVAEIVEEYRKEENEKIQEKEISTVEIHKPKVFDFESLQVVGILFDTYITASDEENFYMIDQHAAHERINYEAIMKGVEHGSGASQLMLQPRIIEGVFPDDSWADVLTDMGYVIDEFGPGTWRIKGIPAFMDEEMAREFLAEYIDGGGKPGKLEIHAIIDRAATKACKASVKAHDVLSREEVKVLLLDLSACENPFHCPHGRPTFIRMSIGDIERRFKR